MFTIDAVSPIAHTIRELWEMDLARYVDLLTVMRDICTFSRFSANAFYGGVYVGVSVGGGVKKGELADCGWK